MANRRMGLLGAVCFLATASTFAQAQQTQGAARGTRGATHATLIIGSAQGQDQASLPNKQRAATAHASSTSHLRSMPAAAQTPISAVLGREQRSYHAIAESDGFRVENSRQGISAEFSSSGLDLRNGPGKWSMRLAQYGYAGAMHDAKAVSPHAQANRIEYLRGELTEWYLNGPFGLEQGFTFSRPPGKRNGPLFLALALSENLTAALDRGARGLTLERQGVALARYDGLLVRDANGKELKSWMEVAENRLQLRIDDARARYPVTVDPLVQSATLTDPDPNAQDSSFGYSTAISSDGGTIVIGNPAPLSFTLNPMAPGYAYVFLRPATGWASTSTYATKLVASNGQPGDEFGVAVSISGDGKTIASLAVPGMPATGSVYIFVEPSGGWTSSSPLQETNVINGPDGFGEPLQLSDDGNTVAVASPLATVNSNSFQGEVEVFATTDGWTDFRSSQLTVSDGAADDFFSFDGMSMSGDGSTIVASKPLTDDGVVLEPRPAYVFVRPSGGWVSASEVAKLTAPSYFGFRSLSLTSDGTTIAIGSPSDSSNATLFGDSGTVYVFVEPSGGWTTTSNFAARLSPSALDYGFGRGVTITRDGTNIIVLGDSNYVFAKPQNGWTNATETVNFFKETAPKFISSLSASDVTSATRPPFLTIVAGEPAVSDTDTPFTRIFTGYALSSQAVVSPGTLQYSTAAGTNSSKSAMLTNSGTAPLGISSVAATGAFSTTQNCVAASPLAPGADCSETVTFSAGDVGTFTGILTFTDDSGEVDNSTQQVSLSGTSVQATTSTTITSAAPNPALVGQAVTFGFSVSPPSGDTLTPSGTVTVQASTGESCTGAAPSGSCSITFSTAVTRTVTATYSGDTNFSSSPSASVSEKVVDFSLVASPSSETISPGHLASYTLTASSVNGLAGTVLLSCGALPPHASCAVSPSSLNLSSSMGTAGVTINLENKGNYMLTFTGSDGALVHSATVQLTVK